ncbi:MAG: hypothetical protein ACR2NI_03715, partial [Pirellulales bacterium]
MTHKNPEACRKWYGRMKQNPEKLQAYRERKRIYMRNYRNGNSRQTQKQTAIETSTEQHREGRLQPIHE